MLSLRQMSIDWPHLDRAEQVAADLIDAIFLSPCCSKNRDPEVVRYSENQVSVGKDFGEWLRGLAPADLMSIPAKQSRGSFLYGSAEFVDGLRHEVAIIGYARRVGNRSDVQAVRVFTGDLGWVHFPLGALEPPGELNEVLLVHNYPPGPARDLKNLLFGFANLASGRDRSTAFHLNLSNSLGLLSGRLGQNLSFFLIENGEAREFAGFSAREILQFMKLMGVEPTMSR